MSSYETEVHETEVYETEVCGLLFRYKDKSYQKITDHHWYDIYTDVTLLLVGMGGVDREKVGQISVEYNFDPQTKAGYPAISLHFETTEGDVHHLSPDTIRYLSGSLGGTEIPL